MLLCMVMSECAPEHGGFCVSLSHMVSVRALLATVHVHAAVLIDWDHHNSKRLSDSANTLSGGVLRQTVCM